MRDFCLIEMIIMVCLAQPVTHFYLPEIEMEPVPLDKVNYEVVQQIGEAVVYIEVVIHGEEEDHFRSGSGFFINEQGLILTNEHVISGEVYSSYGYLIDEGEVDITVVVNSGKESEQRFKAEIIESWFEKPVVMGSGQEIEIIDLALLKIDFESEKYLKFLDISQIGLCYPIWAVGFPLGNKLNVSTTKGPDIAFKRGEISSMRTDDSYNVIIIDHSAPILEGNSGGPLVTTTGYCVGVNVRGKKNLDVHWAIPNDLALGKVNAVLEAGIIYKSDILLLDYGIFAFESENYDSAIAILTSYTEENPEDWKGFYYLGKAYYEIGEYETAIYNFTSSIELDSSNASVFFDRGVTWSETEDEENAIADYDKTVQLNPDYPDVYFYRALEKAALGEIQNAIDDYDNAIKADPESGVFQLHRGYLKCELDDFKGAIKDFDRALKYIVEPLRVFVLGARAAAKSQLGKYEEAIADYNILEDMYRGFPRPDVFYDRGACKFNLGDFENAKGDFFKACSTPSEDPEEEPIVHAAAYLALGKLEYSQENFDQAIDYFDKSIELNPEDYELYLSRANAKLNLNAYWNAIQDYDKFLELQPDDTYGLNNRASAYIYYARTQESESRKKELYEKAKRDCVKLVGVTDGEEGLYNLACLEALLLEKEDAFKHLEEALEKGQVEIDWVKEDADWDHLREEPEYKRIIHEYDVEMDDE